MKQKSSIFIITFCIVICSIWTSPALSAPMNDLQGHWAMHEVNQLIARGAVGGYPDGTFQPDATITRAEFSKILRQSMELATVNGNSFSDTENHWAVSDIQTLVENQIIIPTEYNNLYGPDYNITRREIAIMLVRAMGLNDTAIAMSGETTGFSDDSSIPSYNKGYLSLAKNLGLVGGYEDGTFRPNSQATRAEASVMIVRLLTLMGLDTTTSSETNTDLAVPSTTEQKVYQMLLKDVQRTTPNTLGEQYAQASVQLTVPNETSQSLTITENHLKTIVTYSSGAQAIAIQKPIEAVIAANHTAYINTSIDILLPNNPVANIVFGNQITGIETQFTIDGQTYTFDDFNAALLKAVQ